MFLSATQGSHNKATDDDRLRRSTPPGESRWPVSVFAPLCENVTSSTKPEVHNVFHCRQRRTTGNVYRKFREVRTYVWFRDVRASGQTDRETDTLVAILRTVRGIIMRDAARQLSSLNVADGLVTSCVCDSLL